MTTRLQYYQLELIEKVKRYHSGEGALDTIIPTFRLIRSSTELSSSPTVYEPMLCVLLQGEKRIYVGNDEFAFKELNMLIVPVMMPVIGKVVKATPDKPYLGFCINIDMHELADLVIDMAQISENKDVHPCCLNIIDTDEELMSVFSRLMSLLENESDIPILLPMLKREMLFRLLQTSIGCQLRQFLLFDTQANRVSKAIELIKERYDESLRVKDLADTANMSESSFYNAFKSVTSMSPLQYQKQIRLNEARRIMLHEGLEAAAASYKVGYESPSQFSREYSRLFGISPVADVSRFRK
ncbi:AraC family transcriptional regulator [Alteromonas sp. a30]|uniref:AraC family transcriptional regulator n=1 Tax=Alteromonas sp. a30 TaxID=2730917 RepID=UPI00227F1291|nr:AraC family transcriptional regulator [Alteromonas sp. a30]MCY7293928.1 AraC family transcriptional regulator [Alteromonas sp. a30]